MMTTGLVTEAAREEDPFGFCLVAGGPGELLCLDSFYVGNLKGVGKVYQLTAIDVFTRWATVAIVLGPVNATHTIRFLDQVLKHFRRLGVGVRAVLTDNGPEYGASGFRAHLVTKNLTHVRIPPRSPNHNSVCERFHGTILQEGWRPAFHRRHFTSIRQLQAEADVAKPPSGAANTPTGSATRALPSPNRRYRSTWWPTVWGGGRIAWDEQRPSRRPRRVW